MNTRKTSLLFALVLFTSTIHANNFAEYLQNDDTIDQLICNLTSKIHDARHVSIKDPHDNPNLCNIQLKINNEFITIDETILQALIPVITQKQKEIALVNLERKQKKDPYLPQSAHYLYRTNKNGHGINSPYYQQEHATYEEFVTKHKQKN